MPRPKINKILPPRTELATSSVVRWWYFTIGWAMIVLGVIGVIIPGLPTTVFLIVAVWAFSRSSARFQLWLWQHRVMGPYVRDWYQYRVIPLRGKILVVVTMIASVIYMAVVSDGEWIPPCLLLGVLLPIGLYICTRSSDPPLAPHNV